MPVELSKWDISSRLLELLLMIFNSYSYTWLTVCLFAYGYPCLLFKKSHDIWERIYISIKETRGKNPPFEKRLFSSNTLNFPWRQLFSIGDENDQQMKKMPKLFSRYQHILVKQDE